jgi:hypothetical protein
VKERIDYPQPTGSNISPRRAALFASLPGRLDTGVMTRSEAEAYFSFKPLEYGFIRRRRRQQRELERTCRFAAVSVGVLIGFVSVALHTWR